MWNIKFNHVQDLSDARFAASAMAEWVGFSIAGPFAMNPETIQEIISWCSGPKLILEVGDSSVEKINSFLDVLPVNGIECDHLRYSELQQAFPDVSEWILLGHSAENHVSHSSEWSSHNHIIQLEPNAENAAKIMTEQPFGFSINCQKEMEVGKKDLSHWHDFFEILELF